MTSRREEIQTIIADIENLFAKSGNRLSRVLSGQTLSTTELLERIRDFLLKLNEDSENKSDQQSQLSPVLTKFVDEAKNQSSLQPQDQQQSNATPPHPTQIDFSQLLQPLQTELQALLQERTALIEDIRQLERLRLNNYSLTQQMANQEQMISEFLQVLMNRLVPTLTLKLPQQTSVVNTNLSSSSKETASFETPQELESDGLERLNRFANELDRRLLSLDGTVNVVFDALQRNIHTYHESLSQAIARMHSQGVQGEHLMVSFLNNLTSLLQQQPLSPQPSFIHKEKYSSSPVLATPATSSPTIIQQKISETADLDAVLLQLSGNDSQSVTTPNNPVPSQQSSLIGIGDEVDQLYASLFGGNSSDQNPIVVGLRQPEIQDNSPTAEVSDVSNIVDIPESAINQLQLTLEDNQVIPVVQDINITESSSESESNTDIVDFSNSNLQATSDTVSQTVLPETTLISEENTDESLEPEVIAVPVEKPPSADTITVLGELIINNSPNTSQADKSVVVQKNEQLERSPTNYISANPQENLLFQAEAIADSVFDIALNEDQLQQLDLDLANFDRQLNSQPKTSVDLQIPENTTTEPQVLEVLEISIARKQKEVIEKEFVTTSGSTNHPESQNILDSIWYLGIDLGTTGISAALLNRSTNVVYPIYWSAQNQSAATLNKPSFRLPAEVYLPAASVSDSETETTEVQQSAPAVVASEKVADNLTSSSSESNKPKAETNNLYSAQLKPYLQIAIPYKSDSQKWEPVLQFNDFSAGPLIWVVRSLSKLLLTLKCDRTSTTPGLSAAAVGIDEQSFRAIINNIVGVVCSNKSNWSEQYRFNVREALLSSKLVQHPQQVFFVFEAIASLLSELDGANGETVQFSVPENSPPPIQSDRRPIGSTLVINIGSTSTEMALVDLPENLQELTHSDFMLHSFAYAGKGIEQDIICQLLFPPKWRSSPDTENKAHDNTTKQSHWQPSIPGLDQMQFDTLAWEELELPRPGEPDIINRIRLQQRLESSLLGQAVLDAGLALKLILQHQESFTLELAQQRWVLHKKDLEAAVFVPFVRRLNRELNRLLVAKGIPTEAINQAILTGGVASLSAVRSWLRQKLPNAKIIQDVYTSENAATCSRVAYGLAMLPLHPQVIEVESQQYTDYFLFSELLRLVPERSLSFDEVIQLFENRGINTRSCQQRLLAFLEGELPPGLIPNNVDSTWLTQASKENPDYKAIATSPLFDKQGSLTYRPNIAQLQCLRRYLDAIQASTAQSLEEPYTVNFAIAQSPK